MDDACTFLAQPQEEIAFKHHGIVTRTEVLIIIPPLTRELTVLFT